MLVCDENLQIPVVVTQEKTGVTAMYIPDFNFTVHGSDYIEAHAHAVMYASAIYYYNVERNIKFNLTATYEDAERLIEKKNSFATFICLTK